MAASSRSDWRERHAHSSDRAAGAGPLPHAYSIRQNSAANPKSRFDGRMDNVARVSGCR